jgi:hypothetical protein
MIKLLHSTHSLPFPLFLSSQRQPNRRRRRKKGGKIIPACHLSDHNQFLPVIIIAVVALHPHPVFPPFQVNLDYCVKVNKNHSVPNLFLLPNKQTDTVVVVDKKEFD